MSRHVPDAAMNDMGDNTFSKLKMSAGIAIVAINSKYSINHESLDSGQAY